MSSELSREGRADHLRNRARILAAAHRLLRERSVADVSPEDIAAAAGVGRATLFRHIGSKDALVTEIYRGRVEELQRLAVFALGFDDAWEGFAYLLRTVAGWMHDDRGLYSYLGRRAGGGADPGFDDLVAAMDRVLERARDAGRLRPLIQVQDLLPLLAFTATAPRERTDEIVEVLLRGLRS